MAATTGGEVVSDSGKVARLRSLLFEMERDMGLSDLSTVQRDVFYAARLIADEASAFRGEAVRDQPLLKQVSRPTFYRALKSLELSGYIRRSGATHSGRYCLLR